MSSKPGLVLLGLCGDIPQGMSLSLGKEVLLVEETKSGMSGLP